MLVLTPTASKGTNGWRGGMAAGWSESPEEASNQPGETNPPREGDEETKGRREGQGRPRRSEALAHAAQVAAARAPVCFWREARELQVGGALVDVLLYLQPRPTKAILVYPSLQVAAG